MSDNTLFLNININGFPDNVPDPFFSRLNDSFNQQIRYNVDARRMASIALNAGDTSIVTPASQALTDWDVVIARVTGTARLDTTGKDFDGTTTINGHLDGYGTAIYPGYIILSTYNLSAISVVGLADGTIVQLFFCKSEDG